MCSPQNSFCEGKIFGLCIVVAAPKCVLRGFVQGWGCPVLNVAGIHWTECRKRGQTWVDINQNFLVETPSPLHQHLLGIWYQSDNISEEKGLYCSEWNLIPSDLFQWDAFSVLIWVFFLLIGQYRTGSCNHTVDTKCSPCRPKTYTAIWNHSPQCFACSPPCRKGRLGLVKRLAQRLGLV